MLPTVTAEGALRENARGLREAICRLSNRDALLGVEIVLMGASLPRTDRFVVIQLEQLDSFRLCASHPEHDPRWRDAMRRALAVWDFSPAHVQRWHAEGLQSAFVPLWSTLPTSAFPAVDGRLDAHGDGATLDVLLFGSMSPRREALGAMLRAAGLRAEVRRFTDLQEQEACICAARVVLNVHYYTDAALEVHRLDPLLARGKCVLSERSNDAALDAMYAPTVVFAPYDRLLEATHALLAEGDRALEERGRAAKRQLHAQWAAYPAKLHAAVDLLPSASHHAETRAWNDWCGSGASDPLASTAAAAAAAKDTGEAVFKLLGMWQAARPSS